MENVVFIDTNIWCYYFDQSAEEHENVSKYLEALFSSTKVVVNTVIIIELAHYLIKNLGPIRGREKVDKLLQSDLVIQDFSLSQTIVAVTKLAEYSHTGIGGRDATILATMEELGIKQLVTHDHSFKQIDNITVEDPIK
ncbi:MAG: tRNA(fMet)-specific endonuclease VapC [Candidatus Heimdallarchaeota archaeon LC_2]|nr:MAG: tRNA(fMet)-specific endonuclease VapC [Candidatus Heimdallarchaeota archaeon LC_2]